MGPGTHIKYRIANNIQPVSKEDALALIHDLRYLGANSKRQLDLADADAVDKAGLLTLTGNAMRWGLMARFFGDLDMRGKQMNTALRLYDQVYNSKEYQQTFSQLGVQLPRHLWDL